MKKSYKLLSLFFFVCTLIVSQTIYSQTKKPKIKDDPIGRVIYENSILKDPATGKIPSNIRNLELKYARSSVSKLQKRQLKATTWKHRGPFNVGGRTRALAIDVSNENNIIAGGVSGGIWRSTDGGDSWTRSTSPSQFPSVTAIAQDTRTGHTDTWYYVTGEYSGNSAGGYGAYYNGNGIYKSTDGGKTWSALESTVSTDITSFTSGFNYCWNIAVNPSNGHVYAAVYDGIYKSSDGGTKWEKKLEGKDKYAIKTDVVCSPNGSIMYAALSTEGSNGGVYFSTNGDDWTKTTGGPTNIDRPVIATNGNTGDILYVLTYVSGSDPGTHELWKYKHSDKTWTNLSTNLPDFENDNGDFNSQGGYDLLIKVKPTDEDFVIIGGTSLYRSTDGFSTKGNTSWIGGYNTTSGYANYKNSHADQHSFVFYKDNTKAISGHDGGLSYTSNIDAEIKPAEPVTWSFLNKGYLTTQAYTVAIDNSASKKDLLLSGFQDNGTWKVNSATGTENWNSVTSGDGSYCEIIDKGTDYVTSSQNGNVYMDYYDASGNGEGWSVINPSGASDMLFINPFILDKNDEKIMYYPAGEYIWRCSDITAIEKHNNDAATKGWTKLNNSQVSGATISALDISKTPANTLYYGTREGDIYKMTDANTGSPTKTKITGGGFPSGNIGSITVNQNNGDEVLLSFTNYKIKSIFYTTDGGSSWSDVSGNLEENSDGSGDGASVRWVSFLKLSDGTYKYYAGTSVGLYSTTKLDGTSTDWTQEGASSIGNIVIAMVKTRESDGLVAIGSHANGLYSANVTSGSSAAIDKVNNENDKLVNVFPNPSDGKYELKIDLQKRNDLIITVFNMSGQLVYFNKEKNVKNITKNIDISHLTKGIYNLEVIAGGKVINKKLVIK